MTYQQPVLLVFFLITFLGLALRRQSKRWITAGVAGLFLVSWPPVAWLFTRPLELRYTDQAVPPPGAADAIVVLGSAVTPPFPYRPYSVPDYESYRRCEFAIWLYKNWRHVPVLACGGPASRDSAPVAATMRDLIRRGGIPDEMIWAEERSTSTYTNALNAAPILNSHGVRKIALVVDAQSMPRASACFEKLGFTVVPAPSSYYRLHTLDDLVPSWKAVAANEVTLHEVLGLAWYRLHGRI